jgi:microtubule-associated protein-like 6
MDRRQETWDSSDSSDLDPVIEEENNNLEGRFPAMEIDSLDSTPVRQPECRPDEEDEKGFMATKPWLGAIHRPSKYKEMTEYENNWGAPAPDLELDYVFGYRGRDCRQNLHWIDEKKIIYHAAAIGIVHDLETTDQDFYFGHNDDIICLDYHPGRRFAASGSIGARNEVLLCIWKVDAVEPEPCPEVKRFFGFHQFGVTAIAFTPDGSMVASLGMDEHNSVALYHIDGEGDAALRAVSPCDKNPVIHLKFNTSAGVDSNTCFVTVGVKHVCFWTPAKPTSKTKNYYLLDSEEPIDQRLVWQRGIKCKEIDDLIFYSVSFSTLYTLVGASNGSCYVFSSTGYDMKLKVDVDGKRLLSLQALNASGDTFAVGSQSGNVYFYDVSNSATSDVTVTKSRLVGPKDEPRLDMNALDDATDNESDVLTNAIRSLCYLPACDKLLVGTILSCIYTVEVSKSTSAKPASTLILSGHFGSLKDEEGYGEIWGVAAHPATQHVYTCADDGSVRKWDIVNNDLEGRYNTGIRCHKVDVSSDGKMVAVGHRNGSFTVLSADLKEVVFPNTRHRKREVDAIRFSPNSKYLALASEQSIDIYTIEDGDQPKKKNFKRTAICRGHTSFVASVDWNLSSTFLQSHSQGYELLYFARDGSRVTGTRELADQTWFTQTALLGWSLQGIWPRFADGSDINSVGRSHSELLLAVTDDWGKVKLYNYPCVGSGFDRKGHLEVRPECDCYPGHSSHVANCSWSFEDNYLLTVGGADMTMMAWKVVYPNQAKPKEFLDFRTVNKFEEQLRLGIEEDKKEDEKRKANSANKVPAPEGMEDPSIELVAGHRPPQCVLCGHTFKDFSVQCCPRCLAPRHLVFSKPHAAFGSTTKTVTHFGTRLPPKHLRKRIVVESRHDQPTASFKNSSKEQLKMRKSIESTVKPKTWNVTGKNAPVSSVLPGTHSDPDTDDELLKKKVVATAAKVRTKQAKEKRCSGPDFNDY